MPTLEIVNLGGPLTRRIDGKVNSGLAKYDTSWGYDPYSKPGNLTWLEQPTSLLTLSGTGQIGMVAMKQRTEDFNYVYGLSSTGNLYKIQVNSATLAEKNSPSVIGALNAVTSYNKGPGMVFYGSTEKIFIGEDNNINKINFDGSSASIIGTVTANVPRPMTTFLGKIYFGNGNNIGEIDSTETITTTGKLNPALPSGLYVRDLDLTSNGNYLQITASRANTDVVSGEGGNANLSSSAADSYKFFWNGIDGSYTSIENYSGITLANALNLNNKSYTFGYDAYGTGLFEGTKKITTLQKTSVPPFNAAYPIGNILGFATAGYDSSTTRFNAEIYSYGQYDEHMPTGLFRLLKQGASTNQDTFGVTAALNVSNRIYTPSVYGLPNNIGGSGKIYYSAHEGPTSVSGLDTVNKLWRFNTIPTGIQSIVAGVYETQTEMFPKKITVNAVRVYTDPLVGGNDFTVDLIGSGGSVISGGSYKFTVGTTATAGDDRMKYSPSIAPTYALGVRITNASVTGVANWTAHKIEVDWNEAGN